MLNLRWPEGHLSSVHAGQRRRGSGAHPPVDMPEPRADTVAKPCCAAAGEGATSRVRNS